MTTSPSDPTTSVLAYNARSETTRYAPITAQLLVWQALCAFALIPGLIIGGLGLILSVAAVFDLGGQWKDFSLSDWFVWLLLCATAILLLTVPLTWLVICQQCRSLLKADDLTGAIKARRYCHRALLLSLFPFALLISASINAYAHTRYMEAKFELGFLLLSLLFPPLIRLTHKDLVELTEASRPHSPMANSPPSTKLNQL